MYNSNKITQALVYLLITLARQRDFLRKSDMIYERPSETVPDQFLARMWLFLTITRQ